MTIQPETITPRVANRWSVYSKFPSHLVARVEDLQFYQDKFASFDLVLFLLEGDTTTEDLAFKWLEEKETHRVALVFFDAEGKTDHSIKFENVIVVSVKMENLDSQNDGLVGLRVRCSGKKIDKK